MDSITPTPAQIDAYRVAWRQAREKFPARTNFARDCRKQMVAWAVRKHGIPLQQVGSWTFVRSDWAEVLNEMAFKKEPQK